MFEYIFILYLTHYTRSNKTSFNMYCFRLSPGHQLLLTPSHCYELMMIEGVTSIFNGTGSCDFPFASRKRSLSSISFPSFIFWFVPDTYLFSIKQEKGQSSSSRDRSHNAFSCYISLVSFNLLNFSLSFLILVFECIGQLFCTVSFNLGLSDVRCD